MEKTTLLLSPPPLIASLLLLLPPDPALHVLPFLGIKSGVSGVMRSCSGNTTVEGLAPISRSFSSPFVIKVGEFMFSSSEIGDGSLRRRTNASCCSEADERTTPEAEGLAAVGESTLRREGFSKFEKCP